MNNRVLNLPSELKNLTQNAQRQHIAEGESDAEVYRLIDDTVRYLKVSSNDAQYLVKNDTLRLQWLDGKIATPKILHYSETDTHQYLLMSDCAGLHPLHDDLNWTAQQRIDVLIRAVRDFHAIQIDDCPFRVSFDEQIALARHNIEHNLVRQDLWDEENIGRSIEDLFAEFVSLKPSQEDWVVTHGDMYPMNIRVDEQTKQITGFIDVGAMAVADRYTDLVPITNAIGWHHGEVWVNTFWEQYGLRPDVSKLRFYQLYFEFL